VRKLKQIIKWSIYFSGYLKWRVLKKASLEFDGIAHILLVKNNSYVFFAKICALSFTLYNPKAQVVIHCDASTYTKAKKKLALISKFRNISILLDQNLDVSWQSLKIDLLLSLNGSYDLYMDADLRWRNPIHKFTDVTFLVKEFQISSNNTMSQLLNLPKFNKFSNATMKNTSFFTFGGHYFSKDIILETKETQNNFSRLVKQLDLDEKSQSNVNRLSEQLCLSIYIGHSRKKVNYLKGSDARLDGGIVESPYFGATGLGF
jgi:hypothetical protein